MERESLMDSCLLLGVWLAIYAFASLMMALLGLLVGAHGLDFLWLNLVGLGIVLAELLVAGFIAG